MAEQDWTPSTVMLGHLPKLVRHGFMLAAELKACQVPKDPALPAPMDEYVVSFTAFDERGFAVPPHPFLHSLLLYYGLELHHLTPSGVLHIAIFVTLCEAYLGVDHEAELTISRGAVIHVKLGHRMDPYHEIPMPWSMKGWRKRWFFLKNDDFAPLLAFFGGHPIPLTSWGEGVIGKDLSRIQTLCENLQ
jgi:hypothetical protein